MNRAILAYAILLFLLCTKISPGQIVINEFNPANISGLTNGSGNYDDWIEFYNAGSSSVNLQGYGLSDDITNPYRFRFPSYSLSAGRYLIVFANNVNNTLPVNHWETAVNASTSWHYFAGISQPDTNWRNITFNDAGWSTGNGGIGFGDGDDQTVISTSSKSVMMRKSFNITDTSIILKAIFNIDYDDGFVAYLNGFEIARANLGVPGDRPRYNDLAIASHEAVMYQGMAPDSFFIDPVYLKTILKQGVNVLAVEVHNQLSNSNDLSSIPFLTFGMKNNGLTFANPPSWFNRTTNESFSAKFKLKRVGGTLYLTNPSGNVVDQHSFSNMQSDNSIGRKPDGGSNWCLIKTPTPASSNNSSICYTGYALQPVFSIDAGFYSISQWLTLVNNTPGGVIRYTTDGSTPTTSSTTYSSRIHLTSSKTIRARVFASGYLPSQVITNTYVINDIIKLPVFSITTDPPNLWDNNTGIYVLGPNADPNYPYLGANFWQNWRKPATIEYFDKNKNKIFNFDAEIGNYGNYSRTKPQKSIEISLSARFGTSELNYTFIPDKPYIDKVNDIVLRNSGSDWNVVHFRDAFMERVLKPTHTGYIGTEPAVMYLNGAYWGVFTIHENHDHHWMQNNFHYKSNEIDYMKEFGSTIDVKNGTGSFFWDSYNYATTQNPSSAQYYNDMSSFWDLDNYKDYFIAETFYNNGDWIGDWTNNIKMWRPIAPGGKLRYLVYDLDFGCAYAGSYLDNRLSMAIHPTSTCYSSNMFRSMLNNPQFKREFINRYADLINTIFLPSKMLSVMHQFQDSMSYDMTKHFAKWGSTMSNWQSNINTMVNFINNRPAQARNYIQSQFNLPRQVTLTFNVSPAGAGRIKVSTIVPGPYPWTGVYFNGNPVTITAIPNPGYTFDRWNSNHVISNDHNQTTTYNFSSSTETITAYFSGSSQPALLTVSEFNYHSDSTLDSKDWIELHNYGIIPLNISGWKFKDQDENSLYTFPTGTVLLPNSYLVVSSDLTAFNQAYPSVTNVIGPFDFHLSNGGDQIRIYDANNLLYLSFYYQNISPWPPLADGQGYTCELSSNTANLNNGSSWYAGCIGGSPGRAHTSGLSTTTHVSGNSTFCPGGHTVLSVNYTQGYNYQWQRNLADIFGATDTVFTTDEAGSYTTKVINQGCSSISDALNVSIVSSGQPPVTVSASRCGEGSITLSATATDSIYWFDSPNGNIVGTGPSFTTPTLVNSTTYYAQTSLSCPSSPVPVIAEIDPIPAIPIVSNVNRCGPGSVVINALDTANVNWYNAYVGGGQIFSGNVFVTGYIPNDTTFYAEASSVCVSERVQVNVTITSAIPPVVNSVSRCGSGSLTLTASSLAPILWYDSISAGNEVGNGVSFTTPFLTDTKVYFAESNNGCASARVPATAMVNLIPDPPIGFDSSICGSGSVPIYATSNFQVFWYSTPTGGVSLGSGSLFNTPTINSNTTFYAESNDICSSSRTAVNAIIKLQPVSPVGSDANICGSGVAFLTAIASDPIYWFSQSTGSAVLAIGNNFITPVINVTTVYYAIVISDCPSLPTPVTAEVTPIPSLSLGNDTTIESGSTLILDAGQGFDFYHWSDGETTQTISVNGIGNYSVEVSLNGCTATDEIMVNVVLGIQENSTLNGSINLFPNPVNDKLTMQFESKKSIMAELAILDITGKQIISEHFRLNNGPNSRTLDLSGYAKGIYLVTLRSIDFTKTMCITVE